MSGSDLKGDLCKRVRKEINGENVYVIVGADFTLVTLPYENRPGNKKMREMIEMVCGVSEEMQRKMAGKEE